MSRCRSCKAPIVFAMLANNRGQERLHPFNATPARHGGGTHRIRFEGGQRVAELAGAGAVDASLYVSHFATCPDRAKHRGRGREAGRQLALGGAS